MHFQFQMQHAEPACGFSVNSQDLRRLARMQGRMLFGDEAECLSAQVKQRLDPNSRAGLMPMLNGNNPT